MNGFLSYDFSNSTAIVIGNSNYNDNSLANLPTVENNVDGLISVLSDINIIGFQESKIFKFLNYNSASELGKELASIILKTTDTILLYFAGHGKINDDGELCLTVSGTDVNALELTSIPFKAIKNLLSKSPAKSKILIIDSCFSGRAIEFMGQAEMDIFQAEGVQGTYLMTSVPRNKFAKALDSNKQYTAFTSVLLNTLENGISIPKEYLSLDDIYHYIKSDTTIFNEPQYVQNANIDKFKFALNKFKYNDFDFTKNKLVANQNTIIARIPLEILRKYEKVNKEHQQRFILISERNSKTLGIHNDEWIRLEFKTNTNFYSEFAKAFIPDFEMNCSVYMPLVIRNLLHIGQDDMIDNNKIKGNLFIEKASFNRIKKLSISSNDYISKLSPSDSFPKELSIGDIILIRNLEFELISLNDFDKVKLKVYNGGKLIKEKLFYSARFRDNPGRAIIGLQNHDIFDSKGEYYIEITKYAP